MHVLDVPARPQLRSTEARLVATRAPGGWTDPGGFRRVLAAAWGGRDRGQPADVLRALSVLAGAAVSLTR